MAVVVIGTLDTKGVEIQFVRDAIQRAGLPVQVIDAGVHERAVAADVPASAVFAAAGTSLEAVRQAGDRGKAVEAAARGVAKVVRDLHARGEVDGILGLGGSAGTTIGT